MPLINDKSRKWFIAIIMSLMIVGMALPSWFGSHSRSNLQSTYGTIFGKEKLTLAEIEDARAEWEILKSSIPGTYIQIPIASHMFLGDLSQHMGNDSLMQALSMALQGVREIDSKPEVFALLKREALRANVTINPQSVDNILTNFVRLPPDVNPNIEQRLRRAVTSMVLVETYANQLALAAKVTKPELRAQMAQSLQTLRVGIAVVDAAEFRSITPTPAQDSVQELFNQFKDRPSDDPRFDNNPFGFGYLQPDRVRLEYLTLPRRELVRLARESKSEYDWEVEAQKYYVTNQSQYLTTETPATQPSDASSLSTTPTPSTQKVLKPFEAVKAQILETLIEQRADALATQLQRRISSLLSADYRSYADALSRKTTPPPTSVGRPLNSFDYLRGVAEKIQQETKVLPTISSFSDRYLDEATLAKEPGIGQATQLVTNPTQRSMALPRLLMSRARVFYEKSGVNREAGIFPIENYEPTPVFIDEASNLYFVRITDAALAKTPALDEVLTTVTADAVTAAAQELAKKVAVELGNTSPSTSLMELATQSGRRYYTVPALQGSESLPPELTLSRISQAMLLTEAYNLLRADPSIVRPRAIANLPRDRKVVVLELLDVTPVANLSDLTEEELFTLHRLRTLHKISFLSHFYQPSAIELRTDFKLDSAFVRTSSQSDDATTTQPSSN